jgi:outer membrane murein-binding lipoprotein Lpp
MDSTLHEEFTERKFANFEEQFSNLAREVRGNPSDPPASIEAFSPPPPTIHELADWRHLAFVGSLLAASIGFAAWWWSSSVHTETMAPSKPAPLVQVAPTAVTVSSDLAQQLQPITREIAVLSQTVEQLKVRQDQLVSDNENLARQLKASLGESARNNIAIDQIKADQIEMARESHTLTERLNASQEQLARVIANASEPKVMSEESKVSPEELKVSLEELKMSPEESKVSLEELKVSPEESKVSPEESKVSPEEPKVTPDVPLPRPRRPTDVAQTHKPVSTPARPQAKKSQTSFAWPWSVH